MDANGRTSADAAEVARRAFGQWRHGASMGDWEPFLAMLDDDVIVRLPYPEPYNQEQHGVEEARGAFRFAAEEMRVSVNQTLERPVTANGTDDRGLRV